MKLCNLLPHMNYAPEIGDITITGISADSRKMQKGWLFVAIAGNEADGHDYISSAIANGAVAILGERDEGDCDVPFIISGDIRLDYARACAKFWPKRPSMQVAITGTNGKTSVAEFLRQIWQKATWSAASVGTLGARNQQTGHTLDNPQLSTSGLTTPGAEDLFRVIDELATSGTKYLALEASSHGIEQDRLAPLSIHVAGFTNLSRDHLDYHKDMECYFAAKAKLFVELLPDGGGAAINIDDEYGQKLHEMMDARDVVLKSIGRAPTADLQIIALNPTDYGFDAQFNYGGDSYRYPIALMGRFQAENAILAALLARLSGLSLHDSFGALPALQPIAGRMQPVHGHPEKARILVDYAHTPDALSNVLGLVRDETKGKLAVLFGCGGDRDKGKRKLMGEAALALADVIYITDDNPRSEDPAAIRQDIIGDKATRFIEIGNRKDAIQTAIEGLGAGDCLVIAGKGHETTQTIGHETLPFDDGAVARSVLSFLGQGGAS